MQEAATANNQEDIGLEQIVLEKKKLFVTLEKDGLNGHFFNLYFNEELKKSPAFSRKVKGLRSLTLVSYVNVTTNSLSASGKLSEEIFEEYFAPDLVQCGYDEMTVGRIKGAFGELYVNAVFGNEGGSLQQYRDKGKMPPQELEKNWHKNKVTIELGACPELVVLRVSDEGKGFDCTQLQCGKNGELLAWEGRGLWMITNYHMMSELLLGTATKGFGATIIKYQEAPAKHEY